MDHGKIALFTLHTHTHTYSYYIIRIVVMKYFRTVVSWVARPVGKPTDLVKLYLFIFFSVEQPFVWRIQPVKISPWKAFGYKVYVVTFLQFVFSVEVAKLMRRNFWNFLWILSFSSSFDALKSGYYHLQSKDTRKSVGPTSFVRGHLSTMLEALHTLNGKQIQLFG